MSTTITKVILSPEEIRKLISPLRYESGQIKTLMEETRRRGIDNEQRIIDVQAQCPHENVRQVSVMDCAEMKDRTFCIDCGAQVRTRA